MLKKYKASELVQQAFKLADLNNTAFISHQECIDYLQAAFTEVYNDIIQHGDKQFIREVILHPANVVDKYVEYELPFDFYIMESLKDQVSGRVLKRQTKSSSITSGNYEIVNNRVRVYGGYTGGQGLTLSYWMSPLYISYPDKAIPTGLSIRNHILDTASNSLAYVDEDDQVIIVNAVTGEELATIEANLENTQFALGNGHFVLLSEEESKYKLTYYSFDGTILFEDEFDVAPVLGKDWANNVYYSIDGKVYLMNAETEYTHNEYNFCILRSGLIKYFENIISYNGNTITLGGNISGLLPVYEQFDGRDAVYAIIGNRPGLILFNADGSIIIEHLDHIKALKVIGIVQYGFIVTNGTSIYVESGIPDTEMNFPNEVFYQLIAANLGIRFLMKQNADPAGINSIYENMLTTFYKSLGQNDAYQVVANVL